MSRYVLTPTAQEDLVGIRDYYLDEVGHRIATKILSEFVEAFRFLARHPRAGHRRQDLAGERKVLFWPVRDYLIVYRYDSNPLEIVTVARGSRDLASMVRSRNL